MSRIDAAHSALAPAGVHAQHLDTLWHIMLWTCGVMYVLVLGFVTFALLRACGRALAGVFAARSRVPLSPTLAIVFASP